MQRKNRMAEPDVELNPPRMAEPDREYVLGTGDVEIERLGLQHRVWRPRALDAWQRAGFTVGQTLIDVGCGPGYATLDLAGIVGARGQVIAIDRSRRFLDFLELEQGRQCVANIHRMQLDLDDMGTAMPAETANGAWCRWVLCFVERPRDVLNAMVRTVRPGGALVLHEYFDYRTWRLAPRCAELEEFVDATMASWRDAGGEPDIALELPTWLEDASCRIESVRPIVEVVAPTSFVWRWPVGYLASGLARLVELGRISAERSSTIAAAFANAERDGRTRMITPGVLEIIARRL